MLPPFYAWLCCCRIAAHVAGDTLTSVETFLTHKTFTNSPPACHLAHCSCLGTSRPFLCAKGARPIVGWHSWNRRCQQCCFASSKCLSCSDSAAYCSFTSRCVLYLVGLYNIRLVLRAPATGIRFVSPAITAAAGQSPLSSLCRHVQVML
jgi:hypothetical protein